MPSIQDSSHQHSTYKKASAEKNSTKIATLALAFNLVLEKTSEIGEPSALSKLNLYSAVIEMQKKK